VGLVIKGDNKWQDVRGLKWQCSANWSPFLLGDFCPEYVFFMQAFVDKNAQPVE